MSFHCHCKPSTSTTDTSAELSATNNLLSKLHIILIVFLCSLVRESLALDNIVCDNDKEGKCINSLVDETTTSGTDNKDSSKAVTSIRMVTKEALALHVGVEEGSAISLSILGEVYDVTTGRDYYAQGSSYGSFSGKDCSVCFVSGVFTKDNGDKDMDQVPSAQLPALIDWRNLYAGHPTYKFVGYLLDDRFYNEHGKPTPKMLMLRERVKIALDQAAVQKEERKKKRAALIQKWAEEKQNKERQQIKITIPE